MKNISKIANEILAGKREDAIRWLAEQDTKAAALPSRVKKEIEKHTRKLQEELGSTFSLKKL
jgi:hypothetical protein